MDSNIQNLQYLLLGIVQYPNRHILSIGFKSEIYSSILYLFTEKHITVTLIIKYFELTQKCLALQQSNYKCVV
jgi:hypothetical protein